jgi:hypothetical protein
MLIALGLSIFVFCLYALVHLELWRSFPFNLVFVGLGAAGGFTAYAALRMGDVGWVVLAVNVPIVAWMLYHWWQNSQKEAAAKESGHNPPQSN